jgi:hypothetical protein
MYFFLICAMVSWSTALLEKLSVTKLVKISNFFGTRRFVTIIIISHSEPCPKFRNTLVLYGEGLLDTRPDGLPCRLCTIAYSVNSHLLQLQFEDATRRGKNGAT